jgi:hypothetical protein
MKDIFDPLNTWNTQYTRSSAENDKFASPARNIIRDI